jgi:hypothetical protein
MKIDLRDPIEIDSFYIGFDEPEYIDPEEEVEEEIPVEEK